MKKIMFIILIIVFILVGCKEENKNDNNDNLEIKESEQNTVDENESDEDNKKEDEIIDDSYDIEKSEIIRELNNGSILYYGPYNSIFVEKNGYKEIISNDLSSYPEFSPNKDKFAYIDIHDFETIGNIYIYNIKTQENIKKTDLDYNQQETIKVVKWLDNDNLLVIKGYAYGTVSHGGSLYVLNLEDEELNLLISSDGLMRIKDVEIKDGKIIITKLIWKDENYMEYETNEEEKSIEELI